MGRNLRIVYLSNLVFAFGTGLYQSFMPLYLRTLGADTVILGRYSSFGLLISSLAYFPAAWLCNRFDRKALIIAGWSICIPAPFILAHARSWQWAFVATFLYHITFFANVAQQNYVLHKAPQERLFESYAQVFAAFSLGSVFSQSLGGYLIEQVGFAWVLTISGCLYIISMLLFTLIESDKPSTKLGGGMHLRLSRPQWHILLLFCLFYATCMMPLDFVVPYLRDQSGIDTFRIGLIGSLTSLSGSLLLPQLGRIADRIGVSRTIAINLTLTALSFTLMILAPRNVVSIVMAAITRGCARTADLYTLSLGSLFQGADRSNMLSLFGLGSGLLAAAGPLISGYLYNTSVSLPFTVAAVLVGGCALLAMGQKVPTS